jgi:hypothetical protein
MDPRSTVVAFDSFPASERLGFDAVVIGASALALLGVVVRHTNDVDVLSPTIPKSVLARSLGHGL